MAFRFESLIIALLTFSLMIAGLSLVWGSVRDTYSVSMTQDLDSNFTDVYDVVDETYALSQELKNATLGAEVDEGATQPYESLVIGGFKSLKLISSSFGFTFNIVNSIIGEFGIPPIFGDVAVTAILVMVLFAIIYMIFKYKG